jgi:glycosyltransferase involved in cell wall biosynthesis
MAGALAFCHPSSNESLGIVALESWLAGTPALVNAGSVVLVDHCRRSRGGLWFGNYPEFEEALLRLMDDEPLRRALGAAGRAYVLAEYSWKRILPRLAEALDA